jgi:hypothetical protein
MRNCALEASIMKLLATLVVLSGTVSGILTLTLAQSPILTDPPTSAAAVKTLAVYKDAVRKLDEDYAHRLDTLRQQYVKELDAIRKTSLEKDDLEEAQRLLAEKRRVEAERPQPGVIKGLAILCALHGTDDKWLDITSAVRGRVKDSQFHYTPHDWSYLPDVAVGRHKSAVIAYTFDGKSYLIIKQDDQPFDLPTMK